MLLLIILKLTKILRNQLRNQYFWWGWLVSDPSSFFKSIFFGLNASLSSAWNTSCPFILSRSCSSASFWWGDRSSWVPLCFTRGFSPEMFYFSIHWFPPSFGSLCFISCIFWASKSPLPVSPWWWCCSGIECYSWCLFEWDMMSLFILLYWY